MFRDLTPVKSGIVFGLMAGTVCVLYLFLLYLINIKIFASLWTYIGYIVIVFFKIVAAEMARRASHNIIYFKDALKTAFLVSVISLFMWTAFQHAVSATDPEVAIASKENMLSFIKWSMSLSNASAAEIEKALERAAAQNYGPSLRSDALAYAFFLIVGFFYALIIAGIYHLISKNYVAHHHETANPTSR